MNTSTEKTIRVSQISTGFLEIPNNISLNIYAQGCSLHCPNCQNQKIQNFNDGVDITFNDIKNSIEKHKDLCKWVCWLGGDATYQPESFCHMNLMMKFHYPDIKICLYTGQLFDNIKNLINSVDLVIDGPWTGIPVTNKETNQKIYIYDRNGWKNIDCWDTLTSMMNR